MTETQTLCPLGWREWVSLPELGVRLKCKVDTGARSSALHAFHVEEFKRDGARWVRFGLHPEQQSTEKELWCEAPVLDMRRVRDSGGHVTRRYFIRTQICVAGQQYPIELSLTRRDNMRFRMLLGREALKGRFLVDAGRSYLAGSAEQS